MFECWGKILDAVIDGPRAWSTEAEIAGLAEMTDDDVTECVSELRDQGLLDAWPGKGWTLSPLAAEVRGVCLLEKGINHRLHWGKPKPPRRVPFREQYRLTQEHAQAISDIPEVRPGPAELAQDREAFDRAVSDWRPGRVFDVDNLPWPSVVLTGCESTWSERPGEPANRKRWKPRKPWHCSACRDRKLKPSYVCGRCCRWGLDGLVHAKRREAATLARKAG